MSRILTGIKPTGNMHIGNYFGMLKPAIDLATQHPDHEVFLFIASMHALISQHDPVAMRRQTYDLIKIFLASGGDSDRYFLYDQADVPAHAQLNRVLACVTHMGFMERMHAYKDAVSKGKSNEVSVGLFTYPILMAGDILLYDATHVPVWQDQKQHVEYARDIAQKFNKLFGEVFILPDPVITAGVGVVSGIDGRKMSKSYNNQISLIDDENTILKKVKQIPTDTLPIEAPKDPDTCHVYSMLQLFLNEQEKLIRRSRYTDGGMSYKSVKDELYEKLVGFIIPLHTTAQSISDEYVSALLAKNALRANAIASAKIQDVYQKVWFTH